jgi:very-short-patch-repair endonuclease
VTFRPVSKWHVLPHQQLGYGRRQPATHAEAEFESILNALNDGVLRRRFQREWACGKNWTVNFYFPEVRLAIEIDDGSHKRPGNRAVEAAKYEVTVVHIASDEIFGNRPALVEKLREAWRTAKVAFRKVRSMPRSPPPVAFPTSEVTKSKALPHGKPPFDGGWTSIKQGVTRMGDDTEKVFVDEGFGGTRDAVRAMKKQEFSSLRKRTRGQ